MLDLHFWPTPNGKKVTILLEELGLDYNLVPCNIGRGDQFKPEFLKINPNHRMPVLVDHNPKGGGAPISIFESGAIMMYLAAEAQGQDINEFKYFKRWFDEVGNRPAIKRGMETGNNLRVDPATLTEAERAQMRKIMYNQRAIPAPA